MFLANCDGEATAVGHFTSRLPHRFRNFPLDDTQCTARPNSCRSMHTGSARPI